MVGRDEEAAVQTDAYIDALLATHGGELVALPPAGGLPEDGLRNAIDLLERRMPRIHPSFRFEEGLAGRLRAAAHPLPVRPSAISHLRLTAPAGVDPVAAIDRRLLLGGAIASGVSIAGAAMLVRAAQRRSRPRPARGPWEWLA